MTATLTSRRSMSEPPAAASDDAPAISWEQRRPRLLSHVGRWGRARRWLPADARVVLDVGAASGYGTAAIAAGHASPKLVIGMERDGRHLDISRRSYPWIPMIAGSADNLPFHSGSADAVLLLDVLEHVADPAAVLDEARRILRPRGALVISVPHRGWLERLDSLNVYPALRRRHPNWPPLDAADEVDGARHRHYSFDDLRDLLGDRFRIDRVARTGFGVAEIVHLAILLLARVTLRSDRLYHALLGLHFFAYLADDLVPTGKAAYYITIRARAGSPVAGPLGSAR